MSIGARRAIGAAVATAGLAVLASGSAQAQAPDAHGWWWSARLSGLTEAAPGPPGVPSGGLYVGGSASGPTAVAAVRTRLPPGARPSLVLGVAESTGTPVVGACPASGPWTPADGGPFDRRPGCGPGTVPGALSGDGATITFDLTALAPSGSFDVVIVPGVDPRTGTPATFSLTLQAPGPNSVRTAAAAAPSASAPSSAPGPAFVEPAATNRAVTAPFAAPFTPAPGVDPPSPPDPPPVVPPLPELAAQVLDRPVASLVRRTPSPGDRGKPAALALAVGVAVVAVVLRDRMGQQPRRLVDVPGAADRDGASPLPTTTSGVGRFSRPRVGPPPALT